MIAPPMRRSQNLLALAAGVLAAGALLPIRTELRLTCGVLAILVVVLLLAARMRAHRRRAAAPANDAFARAARIRAARAERLRR